MPESEPPRVRVTLPGGRDLPGQLAGWQQDESGQWWGRVVVHIPAAAVQQIPGEDYTGVPREPAAAESRYVMATDTRSSPPSMELHVAECWEISQPAAWRRLTPLLDGVSGPDTLRFEDTTACPVCLDPETGAPR